MNTSPASGQLAGISGFIRPEFYAKHKTHKGEICAKTTGYTLSELADTIENLLVTGDYRLLYKHFYYADENNNLKFRTNDDD
tara:strand:+ start:321 stop:566 length:246 start_codon:yes stop_codon:yes gene_type:complete